MFRSLLLLACYYSLVGSFSIRSISNDKFIDGTQYTIRNTNITYTQRVSYDGQCSVELDEQSKMLAEGEILKTKHKWYKVEQCRFNRAYPVPCGSKIFYQLRDLACSFVRQETTESKPSVRRHLNEVLSKLSPYVCCESACTISEFIQYCPSSQW